MNAKITSSRRIIFVASNLADTSIIANGWQNWGKKRNVLRVRYDRFQNIKGRYILMKLIGRSWYQAARYHTLEDAISPGNEAYQNQLKQP